MAWEVFPASGETFRLHRANNRAAQPRHIFGALGQRPIADHRIFRVRVHIEYGREVERDADGFELGCQRPRKPFRQLHVAAPAQGRHRGPQREWRLQPGNASTFLIDADPGRDVSRQLRGLATEFCHLPRLDDVPAKQNYATKAELAGERSDFDGNLFAVEASNQQLSNLAAECAR
jgi:hypothetical protein